MGVGLIRVAAEGTSASEMENTLVWQAREAHRKSQEHSALSDRYRQERNALIRRVYNEQDMSYQSLAKQVGCSPELVAKVIQGRVLGVDHE